MLYTFYGTDIKKVLGASQKLIEALKQKRAFAQVFYFYPENFDKYSIEVQQNMQGLFFDKHIFVFKNFIENSKDTRDYLFKNLEKFRESPHLYVVIENEIDEKYLEKMFPAKDVNIKEFNTKGVNIVSKQDIDKKKFDLVASIMNFKSKKTISTDDKVRILNQIQDVKQHIEAPEEFFGILWWRYKKYASFDKENMKKLLDIYHDGHGGEEDIWIGLERWILNC